MQCLHASPLDGIESVGGSISESPDLFDANCDLPASREPAGLEPARQPLPHAARMLTYESEDPLNGSSAAAQTVFLTPNKGAGSGLNSSGFSAALSREPRLSSCLDSDPELSMENASASMAAFVLSTPTKWGGTGRSDFHRALESMQD